jgi:hypothetical protein
MGYRQVREERVLKSPACVSVGRVRHSESESLSAVNLEISFSVLMPLFLYPFC